MKFWKCIKAFFAKKSNSNNEEYQPLKNEHDLRIARFKEAKVTAKASGNVRVIVDRILKHKDRYAAIDRKTRVPWYIIACLHNMESGGNFTRHLHEGSPITRRTRYVPKGRPIYGTPPFTFEESAIDALKYDNLHKVKWRYLFDTLWSMERYNGTGYWKYHKSTPTPYLYAGTSIERAGKYVSDGKWSSTARSKQIGCVAILKELEERGEINFKKLR